MRFEITETDGTVWEVETAGEDELWAVLSEQGIEVRQIMRTDIVPPRPVHHPSKAGPRPSNLGDPPMMMTTTPSIEGRRITQYLGIVTGEAILGANFMKDIFAGLTDLVGGRSATYERELQTARSIALQELSQRAARIGGNAVVGVDLDYEVMGQQNGMMMVSATGTAVVVE